MDEIESKVIKIIGEQLGKDEADIKLESNFQDQDRQILHPNQERHKT